MFAALSPERFHPSEAAPSWPMFKLRSLSSVQPRHFSVRPSRPATKNALRAIAQVVRAGHKGELPLFAATLGLSADEFHELLHEDVQYLSPRLPPELLGTWLPEQFMPLVSLLWSYRATDDPLARWLSHAIAAACYGRQHLWQDLGFNSRDDVSRLIGQWFPRLFNLNTQNLKWKRFLFEQLGRKQGKPGLRPPFCHGCDSYRLCFSGN